MTLMTEDQIRDALRDCYDPQLPCNIVDLGLIQAITIKPDPNAPGNGIPGVPPKYSVTIVLTPTNQTEAAETQLTDQLTAQLTTQIANRLAGFETISRTTIEILPEPPWTPLKITAAGRRILGLDGNPTLVQIR